LNQNVINHNSSLLD